MGISVHDDDVLSAVGRQTAAYKKGTDALVMAEHATAAAVQQSQAAIVQAVQGISLPTGPGSVDLGPVTAQLLQTNELLADIKQLLIGLAANQAANTAYLAQLLGPGVVASQATADLLRKVVFPRPRNVTRELVGEDLMSDTVTLRIVVDALPAESITAKRRLDFSVGGVAQPSIEIGARETSFGPITAPYHSSVTATVVDADEDGVEVASDPVTFTVGHFFKPEKATGIQSVLVDEVIVPDAPATPAEPAPSPAEPAPETPAAPAPETPAEPAPAPAPEAPAEPAPAAPAEPAPEAPAAPAPDAPAPDAPATGG